MAVDFGLSLLFGPPKGRTSQWLADLDASVPALEGHFRSLWMTDHFFWGGEPTYEAWTVMSFLASHFPTFEIGPMVLGQSYRNPALLALMATTLQSLANGRFMMGIGAGWKEDEYLAYGYDYPRAGIRIEQLEDTLIIFKKMWTEPGKVTYHGKHYQIDEAWCEPKPEPMIPIVVGGGGEKTMRLAVQHADMWNLSDAGISRYTERVTILQRHCDELGRDSATLRRSWFGRLAIGATQGEVEKYANSRSTKYTTDNAFVGTPEQVAEQMAAFVALGCDYFMVDIIGLPNPDIIGLVTETLLPKVKSL